MLTGLERHTNEDGAYPKAGGDTLRFVKYVGLKSLFSRDFPTKSTQAARSARLLPRHQGALLQVDRGSRPWSLPEAMDPGRRRGQRLRDPTPAQTVGTRTLWIAGPRCGAAKPLVTCVLLPDCARRGNAAMIATMHKLLVAVYSVAKTCRPFVIIQPASSRVVAIQYGVARSAWPA